MTPLERALERRDAERIQRRASEWIIVLVRERPLTVEEGLEALYQLVQPALGYYPRVDETRDDVRFAGDEEGRGALAADRGFFAVGVPEASLWMATRGSTVTATLRSDEPWAAQQRWWQLVAGAFERLGYEDQTLAYPTVIELFKVLRTLGEIGPLMQFIAIATRHAFDQVAASDGQHWIDLRRRPYLDHDKALRSLEHTDAVTIINLDQNDMTRVPDALSRFPSLQELNILDNPLPPSERARLQSLVPAGCQIR